MNRGVVLANASAISAFTLFGCAVAATRVVSQDIPPFVLATARIGIGAGILWAVMLLFNRGGLGVRRSDIRMLAVPAFFYFTAFPIALAAGFNVTEASRGALLLATTPVWSVGLARMAGRERLSPRQMTGVVVSVAGVAVVFADSALTAPEPGAVSTPVAVGGAALLLFAAACTAIYGVLSQRAFATYNPLTVTAYTMLIGTLFLLPSGILQLSVTGPGDWTPFNTVLLIFLGSLGLAQLMFVFALSRLTPTQVTIYVNLNPLVATLFGAFALGEVFTWAFAVGFVAVLGGAVMVNWPQQKDA
ncbi:MAG: DMT family transporter [Chloroflexota bacterium]